MILMVETIVIVVVVIVCICTFLVGQRSLPQRGPALRCCYII